MVRRSKMCGAATLGAVLLLPLIARAQDAARLDAFVQAEMQRQRLPGVAFAVIKDGRAVVAKGMGLANIEHRVPMTRESVFHSGSITKMFTAAAVMSLIEDGNIALTDAVARFFPDAPEHLRGITIRQLLTHTSGINDYVAAVDLRRDYSDDELLKIAFAQKLQFQPGTRSSYTNTNYLLLGIIVGKVAGKSYGDVLRDRIFVPLGMKTARLASDDDLVPNRAAGYQIANVALKNQDWVAPTLNRTGDGGLLLSLDDLIAWDRGIRSRTALRPDTWAQILTPVRLASGKSYPYGFGWEVSQVDGQTLHAHPGRWQGYTTYIARYPGVDLTVIVMANLLVLDIEQMRALGTGIAAFSDARLAPRALTTIPDPEPAVSARLKGLVAATAAGSLRRDDFPYGSIGRFLPQVASVYRQMLAGLGEPQRLDLLAVEDLGDDRLYTYAVAFSRGSFTLKVAITPDNKYQYSIYARDDGSTLQH